MVTHDTNLHQVVSFPSGKQGLVRAGTPLRAALRDLGESIETICGEKGVCGKCKVRIVQEAADSSPTHLSPMNDVERACTSRLGFGPDERLSCQAQVLGDLVVFVPVESRVGRLAVSKGLGRKTVEVIPAIRKCYIELPEATLEDETADWERVRNELASRFDLPDVTIDQPALITLFTSLQRGGRKATVTLWNDQVIRVEPGYMEQAYGLAVDVGTTTIAGYLCDLATGDVIATEAMLNPQIEFGADIMTRITFAHERTGGLGVLNRAVVDGLNTLAHDITLQVGLTPQDILEVVLVGNTVMHHTVLGLDILPLGLPPFAPILQGSSDVKSRDLGLKILPSANVHVLPLEAGFIGADNVAVLISEEPYNRDEIILIIDIGTNGELVLGNRRRLLSASCATGPALEGACIKFGMRAAAGAIDKVRVDPTTLQVRFRVVGQPKWNVQMPPQAVQARGLCGSGIIDAVAEMRAAGLLMSNGAMDKTRVSPNLRLGADGFPEFVIARAEETSIGQDITVTQDDVRAVQLAKAAMFAGAQVLLRRLGLERPDGIILTGAFGAVIDKRRALEIGLFPGCDLRNIRVVGNAAGEGARLALLNKNKRIEAEQVARRVEYVELASEPGFQEAFLKATNLPQPTRPARAARTPETN